MARVIHFIPLIHISNLCEILGIQEAESKREDWWALNSDTLYIQVETCSSKVPVKDKQKQHCCLGTSTSILHTADQ